MSHLYLLGVATLTLTSAGFAGSDTNADLQARLEAAEARINELSVATNNNWLNDTRSDEIRSLVHDVLADADNRASLQGSGSTASYNGGFTVGSADGNWSLKMNGLLQTSWSNIDSEITNNDDWGFNAVNTWMNFSGTVAGDYTYDVRYNWDTSSAEWANGSMGLGDGFGLTMGTYKVATNRRDMIDDQYQQTLLNQTDVAGARAYTVGNGVSLDYSGDDIRFWGQLYNLTQNVDGGRLNDSQYNANFRLEYMVEGNWGQFDQFTSADDGAAGTLIGVSYNTVNSDGADDSDSTWTIDAQMQFGGSNLYVSYSDFDDEDTDASDANTVVASYGMYLDADWEAYVQYVENDTWTGDEVWSIGVNNYMAGQNAKWTTEISLDDHDANGDVTVISTQLQFYF